MIEKIVDTTWKFNDTNIKEIGELNNIEVMKAALHCSKRIHQLNNSFIITEAYNKIKSDNTKLKRLSMLTNKIDFFVSKLTLLDARAEELGFTIPDDFDLLKKQLDLFKLQHELSTSKIPK
jgi:hypothetical protein